MCALAPGDARLPARLPAAEVTASPKRKHSPSSMNPDRARAHRAGGRAPKKVLEDQLTQVATLSPPLLCWASGMPWAQPEALPLWSPQILRKYGVPKPKFDKSKYSKAGKEQHPGKVVSTKRPKIGRAHV